MLTTLLCYLVFCYGYGLCTFIDIVFDPFDITKEVGADGELLNKHKYIALGIALVLLLLSPIVFPLAIIFNTICYFEEKED